MKGLAGRRLVDDADHGLAMHGTGDHHAPGRNAAHEIGGAVDGIDHPDIACRAGNRGVFLADDAVLRIVGGNGSADEQLDLAVGFRDQILMALALDGQAVEIAEIFQAEFAGPPRQIDGKLHACVMVIFHGRALESCGRVAPPLAEADRCTFQAERCRVARHSQAACDSDLCASARISNDRTAPRGRRSAR